MSVISPAHMLCPQGVAATEVVRHALRWTVSAHALRAACEEWTDAAPEREDATLSVLLEIGPEGFRGEVSISHQTRHTRLADIAGSVEHTRVDEGTMMHLDSDELVATLRLSNTGPQTLYARLPLLSRLGIAGGRYELRAAGR